MSHPNVIVVLSQLSHLESAVLVLLQSGEPLTLPEIESVLYGREFHFDAGAVPLALVRLQERNLVANTLAFYARRL